MAEQVEGYYAEYDVIDGGLAVATQRMVLRLFERGQIPASMVMNLYLSATEPHTVARNRAAFDQEGYFMSEGPLASLAMMYFKVRQGSAKE